MKQQKIFRWKDGHECPDNLTGHIIVFDDPLIVHQTKEVIDKPDEKGIEWRRQVPTGEVTECKFMRATGGFGSFKVCSGRMILGKFFKSIKDIKENKPFDSGNTKCFPDGYIPDLFDEKFRER